MTDRVHAILSASGSKLWLTCAAAAHLNEIFIDDESEYSAEGTRAHDLAEKWLRHHLFGELPPVWGDYDREMVDAVKVYIDHVASIVFPIVKAGGPYHILVERRVDYSRWVPEGFGRSDCIIATPKKAWQIDLKYGKGVQVFAENNSQGRLYGGGTLEEVDFFFDEIEELETVIVQPRLDHIDSEVLKKEDLLAWLESIREPAQRAWNCTEPTPEDFVPGDHCSSCFCKARFTCKARSQFMIKLAEQQGLLNSDDDIAALLPRLPLLKKWATELLDMAQARAIDQGMKWKGMKLVAGRSNRFISDPQQAIYLLKQAKYQPDDFMKDPELRGITELEKLCGKKGLEEVLGGVISKAAGKPTLVPESDKRAEWKPHASADDDFGDL